MKLSATDTLPRRTAGLTLARPRPRCPPSTGRPVTRRDWLLIAACAAFAGVVALMNIRAA